MYKPSYVADSALLAPLAYGGLAMRISEELAEALDSTLIVGDWTYLQVNNGRRTEVVKVWGVIGTEYAVIDRAQDNTEEWSFPIGATISHVDTAVGVLDSFTPQPLQLDALGAIEISSGHIRYKELSLAISKGSEIVGDDPKITIGNYIKAYGCCPPRNPDA